MIRTALFAVVILLAGASVAAQPDPLPESPGSTIGYPNVAAALQALKADPNVKLTTQAGWTVGIDDAHSIFWSFPPPGNPAYPAAVKRHVVERDGAFFIGMDVLCEASKVACDKLVTDFKVMNASLKDKFTQKP